MTETTTWFFFLVWLLYPINYEDGVTSLCRTTRKLAEHGFPRPKSYAFFP